MGIWIAIGLLVLSALCIWGYVRWRRGPRATPTNPAQPPTPNKWGGWFKKNWGWVVLFIICLPFIWLALIHGTSLWIAAWWLGQPQQVTIVAQPTGKSFGGPILWSSSATVQLRNRFTVEEVRNGVAFVGVVPPTSWVDLSLSCVSPLGTQWGAFLISRNSLGFLPENVLRTHAISRDYTRGTVFPLPGLSDRKKMSYKLRYENYTGKVSQEGFKLNELYIQTSEGGPEKFLADRQEPKDTFQYVVEVGLQEISLTPPAQWKWLWIAPVHHEAYQASLDEDAVPSEGITQGTWKNFLGIVAGVRGEDRVLEEAILLQQGDSSETITLTLNAPARKIEKGIVKPAKVIVGIQL